MPRQSRRHAPVIERKRKDVNMISPLFGQSAITKTRTIDASWNMNGINGMKKFEIPLKAMKILQKRVYKHRTRKGIKTTYIYQDPLYLIVDLFSSIGEKHRIMTESEFFEYRLKSKRKFEITTVYRKC